MAPMPKSLWSEPADPTYNVNGYIPLPDFARELQCPPDDDLNDDGVRSVRQYKCPPDCPGHKCKYGCGQMIHSKDFQTHKYECPEVEVRCKASRTCNWYGPRRRVQEHIKDCKHVLLLPATHANEVLQQRLQQLARDLYTMTNDLRTSKENAREVQRLHQKQLQQMAQKLVTLEHTVNDLRISNIKLENQALSRQLQMRRTSML